jgi:hypothetical protein
VRRDKIGSVFQAYNLLPLDRAGDVLLGAVHALLIGDHDVVDHRQDTADPSGCHDCCGPFAIARHDAGERDDVVGDHRADVLGGHGGIVVECAEDLRPQLSVGGFARTMIGVHDVPSLCGAPDCSVDDALAHPRSSRAIRPVRIGDERLCSQVPAIRTLRPTEEFDVP